MTLHNPSRINICLDEYFIYNIYCNFQIFLVSELLHKKYILWRTPQPTNHEKNESFKHFFIAPQSQNIIFIVSPISLFSRSSNWISNLTSVSAYVTIILSQRRGGGFHSSVKFLHVYFTAHLELAKLTPAC